MKHAPYPMTGGLVLETQRHRTLELPPEQLESLPPRLIFPYQHRYVRYKPLVQLHDQINANQAIAYGLKKKDPGQPTQFLHTALAGQVTQLQPYLEITVDPDQPVPPPPSAPQDYSLESGNSPLNTLLAQHGVLGLGGAMFPTSIKTAGQIHTLLINGVECEPLLTADACLMTHDSAGIRFGFDVLQQWCDFQRVFFAIETDKPKAIRQIDQAFKSSSVQLIQIPTRYPAGGERQLYQQIFGQTLQAGVKLADLGILSLNVQTLLAIGQAACGNPLTQRLVTLTGAALHRPQNLWLPIGTPVDWLLNHIKVPAQAQITLGGPLMGAQLSAADLVQASIRAGTSAVIAEPPVQQQEQPCIRCNRCEPVCPEQLQPQDLYLFAKPDILNGEQSQRAQQSLTSLQLSSCIACGACDVVCPSQIQLSQHFKTAQNTLARTQAQTQLAQTARAKYEARQKRLQQPQRANPAPVMQTTASPPALVTKPISNQAAQSVQKLKTNLAKAQRLHRQAEAAFLQALKKGLDDTTLVQYQQRVLQLQTKAEAAHTLYQNAVNEFQQ